MQSISDRFLAATTEHEVAVIIDEACLDYELIQAINDDILIRFAPDRSVSNLPNLIRNAVLYYPYTGNRFPENDPFFEQLRDAQSVYQSPGYYVSYIPANSPSISSLGRMGGKGNGETIQL